jgi:class 3 adenylate cyclase
MSKAPPGQIYVSDRVREATGDAFIWDDLDPIMVKGRTSPSRCRRSRAPSGDLAHARDVRPADGRPSG